MKKVLIIPGTLNIGGAEKVCRDIGYYAKNRFVIHYLVFGDHIGEYEKELIEAGCKVIHAAPPSDSHTAYYKLLVKLLREENYDVVHSHTMFNSGWAMLAAKRCGVPVRIAHSHSALDVKRSAYKKLYEAYMRRMVLKNATVYAACGQRAGERLFGKKAFAAYGKLILNGIQTEMFEYNETARRQIREELELNDKYIIGHVGHLVKVKNQSFLIRIMPRLLERIPNAFLIFIGDGNDKNKLTTLIETLNLSEHVKLIGNVRNVNEYLSAMDVFAFPSLYEGLPLSIVEVQANGLPCIISDRVPKDAFVTDLLMPVQLEAEDAWVEAICNTRRKDCRSYCAKVRNSGLDIRSFLEKIYSLYDV